MTDIQQIADMMDDEPDVFDDVITWEDIKPVTTWYLVDWESPEQYFLKTDKFFALLDRLHEDPNRFIEWYGFRIDLQQIDPIWQMNKIDPPHIIRTDGEDFVVTRPESPEDLNDVLARWDDKDAFMEELVGWFLT